MVLASSIPYRWTPAGFSPVGTYHRIGWKGGAWRDVGWWELELIERSDDPPPEPGPPARLPEPLCR